jgi:hypothetical protein
MGVLLILRNILYRGAISCPHFGSSLCKATSRSKQPRVVRKYRAVPNGAVTRNVWYSWWV